MREKKAKKRGTEKREDNLQVLVFSFLHVGPNSDQQAWQQAPSQVEPSHLPCLCSYKHVYVTFADNADQWKPPFL